MALVLVLVTTVILGAFASYNYHSEELRRTQRLRDDQVTWTEQLAVGLELPVWNFDHQQIDDMIDSAMRDREILAVDVRLADRAATRHIRARSADGRIVAANEPPPTATPWVSSHAIMADDDIVGTVTVHVTPRFLQDALGRTLRWMLLTIAVFDVLLTTCLYVLLKKLVLRPLTQLEDHAVELSSGAGELEALEGLRFRGEIETLRGAIARMVRQLRSRYAELQRTEASLREAQGRELQAREDFSLRLLTTQELERRRIAGELHDSVGQDLSLIANRAQLALDEAGVPDGAASHLRSIIGSSRNAIAEVRALVRQLRPLHIEQLGFTTSLDALLDQVMEGGSLAIDRQLDNIDDVVSGERATHLYRIVQEALNNVMRHAGARRVSVQLQRDLHCLRLSVQDDGQGFDWEAAQSRPPGLGLTSMLERSKILGGSLQIESAPGRGTSIIIEVPVPEEAAAPGGA